MNKNGKKPHRWLRRAALVLVVLLILGWIGSREEDSSGAETEETGQEETGQKQETQEETAEESEEESEETTAEELSSGTGTDSSDEQLLQRMGLLEDIIIEISTEDGSQIDQIVAGMWSVYAANTPGKDPLVEERDWSVYSSSLGKENLSRREAAFFERLDKTCLKYLSTSGLDGAKYKCSDGAVYYATDGVKFSDLGLSKTQAINLLTWFVYNNPQYYFLLGYSLSNSDSLFLCMYDFTSDGEERAKITNELFDKLEGWIQTVADGASTFYQKEFLANKLICEIASYDYDAYYASKAGDSDAMWVCQSLYSSVILENTVCAGYSKTFCAMMSALGVDATAGLNTGCHAWNVVRADDGNYYAVDVCWNDTDSTPAYQTDYLNIGEEIMSMTSSRKESHTYSDDVAAWIPAIAKDSYVPAEEETDIGQFGAPQNFRVRDIDATSVTLAWDEVAGAKQYQVAIFTDASRSEVLTNQSATQTGTGITHLLPNTVYELGVCATRLEDGKSVKSDWTYLTIQTEDGEPEKSSMVPTDITTAFKTEDTAYTTWSGINSRFGQNYVEVCQYTDASCTEMVEGYPKKASTYSSQLWSDLEVGKTYYFGVRAAESYSVATIYSDWVNFSYTHTGTS